MSTEGEQDFAAFEAAAKGETVEAPTVAEEPKGDEAAEAKDEPLELTDGDEAVDVPEGEDGGEADPKDGKRRSKPASQRIAELTAKLRAAERQLEARNEPAGDEGGDAPERPNAADYEFGEADPKYVEDLVKFAIAEDRAERSKVDGARAEQQAWQDRIETGVAKAQAEATEKYEDFEARIAEAVEARGGEPLPPLLSVAIGVSPAGGDILYRLATDEAASKRLEALAKVGGNQASAMAMAFGELEGEYLADTDDADLDMSDQLDMARMMGRMRARLKGSQKPAQEDKRAVTVTNAPEPPSQRARGAGGQFETTGDTTDFAAFERKVNGRR